jgi:hypothetical protein
MIKKGAVKIIHFKSSSLNKLSFGTINNTNSTYIGHNI